MEYKTHQHGQENPIKIDTKMKNYLVLLTAFAFLLLSCKDKVKKYYYDSGELYAEEFVFKGNDSIIYIKEHYKNGVVKQEGHVKNDSIKDGHWKYYYADGSLRWEGKIINSVIQDDCKWQWEKCVTSRLKGLEIEGNPTEFIVGNTYKFRVIMPETHPQFYILVDKNYQSLENTDEDQIYFPYKIKCADNFIILIFMNEDGIFTSGNPSYAFFISPSKTNKIKNFYDFQVGDTVGYVNIRTYSDGTQDTIKTYK
jgi:hypothetical protein